MSRRPPSRRPLLASSALLLATAVGTASAQFVDPDDSAGSSGSANPSSSSVRDQSADTLENFDGINVKVHRMVRVPGAEPIFKVALQVTETGDAVRRVALIQPQATLTDENGNRYVATETTGLKVCSHREMWDVNLANCYSYANDDLTRLTPGLATMLWLTFVPEEDGFSAELAKIAERASLQTRFAYFSDDFENSSYADVIIPGITLP